jgi:hypothetical protein
MTEPWDVPSFPKHGNKSQATFYAAIGRALMNWEEVEGALAHLYSALTTNTRFDVAANREYGTPDNFAARLHGLDRCGQKYFVTHHSQTLEGDFAKIIKYASGYSTRRNEIAHGRARPIQWVRGGLWTGAYQWCVIPAHFRGKKFTKNDRPSYVYTSREMNRFAAAFWEIALWANDLGWRIETPQTWRDIPILPEVSRDTAQRRRAPKACPRPRPTSRE